MLKLLFVPAMLFVISLFTVAFYYEDNGVILGYLGLDCYLSSIIGVFAFPFAWPNFLLPLSVIIYTGTRFKFIATSVSLICVPLSLLFLLYGELPLPIGNPRVYVITNLGSGFYVWVAMHTSVALIFVCHWTSLRRQNSERVQ